MELDESTQPIPVSDLRTLIDEWQSEHSDDNQLRLRRCVSWLENAHRHSQSFDFDSSFVFHWISFNSMYALPNFEDEESSDVKQYKNFLTQIAELDTLNLIISILRPIYGDTINPLLRNKFVYSIYWKNDFDESERKQVDRTWEEYQEKNVKRITLAFSRGKRRNPKVALHLIFDLLYSLRNQLFHGSSTYFGSLNREQVQTGAVILSKLIPCFIEIILTHPEVEWGTPPFPPHNQ